jgi:hypothetical protein
MSNLFWYKTATLISRLSFFTACVALINEEIIFAGVWFAVSEFVKMLQKHV